MTQFQPRPHAAFAMVALNDFKLPDAIQVQTFLRQTYPDFGPLTDVHTQNDTLSFIVGETAVSISLMSAPIPWSELEGPVQTAWYWKEAMTSLKSHVAHILVASISRLDDVLAKNLLVMKLTAAVAATTNSAGVYWPNGFVVNSPADFVQQAHDRLGAFLPLNLLVNMQIASVAKNIFGLRTLGMEALGKPEIEITPLPLHPSQLFDIALGLATYSLTSGKTIANGDTIGRSATEKIRVTYGPSRWEPSRQVMQLTLE